MRNSVLKQWPSNKLEEVGHCPACGSNKNKGLESNLIDLMSKPVTGPWLMRVCVDCGTAYLSPRPDSGSIGEAYNNYYTHTSDKDDLVHSRLRSLKNYIAEQYYAVLSGSGGLFGRAVSLILYLLPPLSTYLDAKSRHIFKVKARPGRLLDVGCGNGEFLRFANKFGWNVVGVDFDKQAVIEAKSSGLDARLGGIEIIGGDEKFDFISLSHVIEHVYDPADLIRSCYERLNDGGVLWLETPNIDSIGYTYYKASWRGLEPPRHIMLFNQASLNKMLFSTGFSAVEQKLHGLSGVYMGLASEKQLTILNPCGTRTNCAVRKIIMLLKIVSLEFMQMFNRKRREFLTVVAIR